MRSPVALFFIAVALIPAPAVAAGRQVFAAEAVVCSADSETPPTDFSGPDCETMPAARIDPQGRHIWVRAAFDLPGSLVGGREPVGLFLSAKASSEVFVNGARIGSNGIPGKDAASETPGRMDAVFYLPPYALREGVNTVTIRMSSHHGFLKFVRPTHFIAVAAYETPQSFLLRIFWPSLIPFGALLAGALYFAAAAVSTNNRVQPALLALLSLFAAGQLFVEGYRSLSPYPYPAHEWRVIMIVVLSGGFGLCLAALVCATFLERRRGAILAVIAAVTISASLLSAGYDAKAAVAILTPTIFAAIIASVAAFRRKPQGALYCVTLSVFAATIAAFPNAFLNTLFFFEVAALMLVLFAAQAVAFERERHEREEDRTRARQLEQALERATEPTEAPTIRINGAGSVNVIRASDITHCKGAGDYIELHLADGRRILHNGALAQIEAELPASFLRVHRSFIVNTAFVKKLTRESSGVGALTLTTGAEVPVSRRVMPKVRSALA